MQLAPFDPDLEARASPLADDEAKFRLVEVTLDLPVTRP